MNDQAALAATGQRSYHGIMMSRIQIAVLLGIAALIWAIALWAQGQPVHAAMINPFSTVVGVLVGVLWLYDRYLWKWWPLHRLFGGPLVLHGEWEGTLTPTPAGTDGAPPVPEKEVTLIVKQQPSALHLRLRTNEGESVTLLAREFTEGDGVTKIVGFYLHTPNHEQRGLGRNQIHHGAVILRVEADEQHEARELTGHFFTDKQPATSGKIFLRKKQPLIRKRAPARRT